MTGAEADPPQGGDAVVAVVAVDAPTLRLLRRHVRVLYVTKSGHPASPDEGHHHTAPVRWLLIYDEVEELTGYTPRHIGRLVASGQLKAVKSGRITRIHRDDLAAFIERLRERDAS